MRDQFPDETDANTRVHGQVRPRRLRRGSLVQVEKQCGASDASAKVMTLVAMGMTMTRKHSTSPGEDSAVATVRSTSLTSSERVNTMAHYHRAEIARMAGWRERLDRTTNRALAVAAAMLSVWLATPSSHHGVVLFAVLLILLLLWIEVHRYRFFDVYRSRVRQFERHYIAQIFSPQPDFASNSRPTGC